MARFRMYISFRVVRLSAATSETKMLLVGPHCTAKWETIAKAGKKNAELMESKIHSISQVIFASLAVKNKRVLTSVRLASST